MRECKRVPYPYGARFYSRVIYQKVQISGTQEFDRNSARLVVYLDGFTKREASTSQ